MDVVAFRTAVHDHVRIRTSNPTYVSPTDNMMTPCSQKLNATKKKHFTKYVFSFPQDVGQY